jgi:hypothetical protein
MSGLPRSLPIPIPGGGRANPAPNPFNLVALPQDMITVIASHLENPGDAISLARTCRDTAHVLPRAIRNLDGFIANYHDFVTRNSPSDATHNAEERRMRDMLEHTVGLGFTTAAQQQLIATAESVWDMKVQNLDDGLQFQLDH